MPLNRKNGFVFRIVIALALLLVNFNYANAHPPLPTEFYGTVTTYNSPAMSGVITAYAGTSLCGAFTIVNGGYYGVLSCEGADPQNPNSGGANANQQISFKYNGDPASAIGDGTYSEGTFKLVNITHPLIYCGDSFCDLLENCMSCPKDCNECNYTGNATTNVTNGTTNIPTIPTTPSGQGAGTGKGAGGGGKMADASIGDYYCTENWVCGNWSLCLILGLRNRQCSDYNNCGTYKYRPKEVEECTYVGTCFDNLVNCHDDKCEEGLDCGGPCEKKCPVIEQPLINIPPIIPKFEIPKHVCERHMKFQDPSLWIYLAIILISIGARHAYSRYYISKLRNNEKITALERSKKIRSSKRKNLLFTVMVVVLTIISLVYSYYFIQCPLDFMRYSWMFVVALIIVPFLIHALMKKYEYSESRHIYTNKKVEDTHYQSIVRMIELENSMLSEEENSIANRLYELSKKEDFKDILEKDYTLKQIYNNLIKLYTDYGEKKNPFNVEKAVCEEINSLDDDVVFKEGLAKHDELKHIFDRLKKLYSQYEEKQKLYDKLDEIEQGPPKEKKDDGV